LLYKHASYMQRSGERGFTLMELLLCLCLISIIGFFSLTYLPPLYKKNHVEAISADIKTAIHAAKLQALVMGKTLVLTRLPDTKDWSRGMLLFEDNANHQFTPDIKPLYQWHWKSTGTHVSWHGFRSSEYLLFATDLNSCVTNGFFTIQNNGQLVKLIVNRVGRVRKA